MKKVFLGALVLSAGAAVAALGQEGAAASPSRDGLPRIAVIDIQAVMSESVLGKEFLKKGQELQSQYQAEVARRQAEVEKLNQELSAMQQDLQKQASVLSEEAVEEKQQALRRKEREAQATVFDYEQEMQRKEAALKRELARLQSDVEEKLRPHIQSVFQERKLDILLVRGAVAYMTDAYDISKEVVRLADQGSATAKPAAAAKPAAGAKP